MAGSTAAGLTECVAGRTGGWIVGSFGAPSGPQSSLCQATVIVKPAGPVFLVLVRVVRAGLAGQVKGFAGLHEKGVNCCSFRGWIACRGGITKLVQE